MQVGYVSISKNCEIIMKYTVFVSLKSRRANYKISVTFKTKGLLHVLKRKVKKSSVLHFRIETPTLHPVKTTPSP